MLWIVTIRGSSVGDYEAAPGIDKEKQYGGKAA
jgi:hypothetical protein